MFKLHVSNLSKNLLNEGSHKSKGNITKICGSNIGQYLEVSILLYNEFYTILNSQLHHLN